MKADTAKNDPAHDAASGKARGELSDQMVDDGGYSHGGSEVEFVDCDEGANSPRGRESRVGE